MQDTREKHYTVVSFVLAMEHTLLGMLLNIWRKILFPGNLHDAAHKNFCTVENGNINCPHGLQLPVCLSNYQRIST